MAYIQVTFGTNYITFVTNDLASVLGFSRVLRLKTSVIRVVQKTDHIQYFVPEQTEPFNFSHELNSKGFLKVDTVNGVTPTSLSNLFDLLATALDS